MLYTLSLIGCAHMSTREKTLLTMGGAVLVGGAMGYLTTPKDGTSSMGHAALWSGISGAAAGGASLFLFDDSKKQDEMNRQIEVLKKELEASRSDRSSSITPELDSEIPTVPGLTKLPKEVQGLVKPGKWQLFKTNHWRMLSDSIYIHEDKMLKLTPPQLNLGRKADDDVENNQSNKER